MHATLERAKEVSEFRSLRSFFRTKGGDGSGCNRFGLESC